MNKYEEQTFMYILDMCQSLDNNVLEALINNIKVIIENREDEENEI